MKQSILKDKSLEFAIRVVNFYKYLCKKNEYVISKQLLRSGTAIGALISEGYFAESKADFVHKYAIAQKECNETKYWLELLFRTNFITEAEYESLHKDATELMKMITASIVTIKKNSD
jgi:four helix bundle protein